MTLVEKIKNTLESGALLFWGDDDSYQGLTKWMTAVAWREWREIDDNYVEVITDKDTVASMIDPDDNGNILLPLGKKINKNPEVGAFGIYCDNTGNKEHEIHILVWGYERLSSANLILKETMKSNKDTQKKVLELLFKGDNNA